MFFIEIHEYLQFHLHSLCSLFGFTFQVLNLNRRLCAELTPHALALVEAFGLSQDVLAAPIAGDWVGYNDGDNQGELGTKKEFLEILKKATEANRKG